VIPVPAFCYRVELTIEARRLAADAADARRKVRQLRAAATAAPEREFPALILAADAWQIAATELEIRAVQAKLGAADEWGRALGAAHRHLAEYGWVIIDDDQADLAGAIYDAARGCSARTALLRHPCGWEVIAG